MSNVNTEQTDDLIGSLSGKFGDGSGVKKGAAKTEKTEVLNFKNGDTVFRILPPMFSCVQRNVWAAFSCATLGAMFKWQSIPSSLH